MFGLLVDEVSVPGFGVTKARKTPQRFMTVERMNYTKSIKPLVGD